MDDEHPSGSSGFGRLLREYRLSVGLSQEALAERARMSSHGVSALERGYRRSPHRDTLALLARALDLDDEQRGALELAAARPGAFVAAAKAPNRTAIRKTRRSRRCPAYRSRGRPSSGGKPSCTRSARWYAIIAWLPSPVPAASARRKLHSKWEALSTRGVRSRSLP